MGALHVIRGILDGLSVGTTIRQAQLQEQARQREIARQDREDELRDVEFQLRMNQSGAKRVDDAGMVTEPIRYDGKTPIPGMIGADAIPEGAVMGESIRKSIGGQTIRRRQRDGKIVAYEVPTLEQQQANAYEAYDRRERSKQRADETARLERGTEELNRFGVDLPEEMRKVFGTKKVSPQRLAEFASAFTAIQKAREKENQPMIDPRNLSAMPPIPADQAGGVASLIGRIAPGSHYFNNYENDTTTAIRENPLTGEYSTKKFSKTVAPRPNASKSKGGSGEGRQPTQTMIADALVEKVMAEDTSGDIDNAIRNVDKFYQNDPELSKPGMRMLVKAKLQKLKRNPKFMAAQKDRQPEQNQATKQRVFEHLKGGTESAGERQSNKKNDPLGIRE
jgi:hypothetical protein